MANPKLKGQLANIFGQAQLSVESQTKAKKWMEWWCLDNSIVDLLRIRANQVWLLNMFADCNLDPNERIRFTKSFLKFAQISPEKVRFDKLAEDTVKHAGGLALGTAGGSLAAAGAAGGTTVAGVGLVLATQGTSLATAGICTGGALVLTAPVVGFTAAVVALEKTFQWATADSRKDFGSSWSSHQCAVCGKCIHNRGCPRCESRLCEICFERHCCATAAGAAGSAAAETEGKEAAADTEEAIIDRFLTTLARVPAGYDSRMVWIGDGEELDEKSAQELEATYKFDLAEKATES